MQDDTGLNSVKFQEIDGSPVTCIFDVIRDGYIYSRSFNISDSC